MTFPRPDEESKAFFQSVIPDAPGIQIKPMFGNVAGFVNGNMFAGLFGSRVFVRLTEEDRAELLQAEGTSLFTPMPDRPPMREYVEVPDAWRQEPERVREWVARSLAWVGEMPEKQAKKRKKKG